MRLYPDLAANRICCSSRWWIRRQRHHRQQKPTRRAVKRKPHRIKPQRSSNWRASGKIFPPRRATCSMENVAKWSNCTANWRRGSRAGWRDNRQSNTVKIVVMFLFFYYLFFIKHSTLGKKKMEKTQQKQYSTRCICGSLPPLFFSLYPSYLVALFSIWFQNFVEVSSLSKHAADTVNDRIEI